MKINAQKWSITGVQKPKVVSGKVLLVKLVWKVWSKEIFKKEINIKSKAVYITVDSVEIQKIIKWYYE